MSPRKNNPEQTRKHTIEAASRLFTEKGFDGTSVQDIVDAVGMSKGAIFHHFNSKEEILYAVADRELEKSLADIERWAKEGASSNQSARDRIADLLLKSMTEIPSDSFWDAMNAQMTMALLEQSMHKMTPVFAELLAEGVADGSIDTCSPGDLASMIVVLLNVWLWPEVSEEDEDRFADKLGFLQQSLRQMGADIISDCFIERCISDYRTYANT